MFSGLNNLTNIALDARYRDLCGYTDEDVDTVFAPDLSGLSRALFRQWCDGYNSLSTSVYNLFGPLMLFDTLTNHPHGFEAGTPSILINLLPRRRQFTPELGRILASESRLSAIDVDNIPVEATMFQAGCLTIAGHRQVVGGCT